MKGKHCEQDHDYDKPLLLVRAGSLDPLQRQRTGISLDPGAVIEDGDGLLGLDHDIDAWSEQPEAAGTTDDDEFAARDEEMALAYERNPMGFTAGLKFKGE